MNNGWLIGGALTGCILFGALGCKPDEPVFLVDPYRAAARAEVVLRAAAADEDATTRANAMEAMAIALDTDGGDLMVRGLDDKSPMVRFAAAMAIGDVAYSPALDRLREIMDEEEPEVTLQCGIIYALHQLGDVSYNPRLGVYLWEPDRWVRANTTLVMGKIGDPSAIGPLKSLLRDETDDVVQINIIESLASLGDVRSAMELEGYCRLPFERFGPQQLVALRAVARLVPGNAKMVLSEKVHHDKWPRVRVVAAGGLARMGVIDEKGYELCLQAIRDPMALLKEAHPDVEMPPHMAGSLQQVAAVALGWFGRTDAIRDLQPLLTSEQGPVRVAAAMSIILLAESADIPQTEPPAEPTAAAAEPNTVIEVDLD